MDKWEKLAEICEISTTTGLPIYKVCNRLGVSFTWYYKLLRLANEYGIQGAEKYLRNERKERLVKDATR